MAKGGAPTGGGHAQISIAGIVLIRLFLGGLFLYNGIWDVLRNTNFLLQLRAATADGGEFILGNTLPAFSTFLSHTVHPHYQMFGWVLIVGELLIGVLFLFGLLTRLAALLAIPFSLFFLLATLHTGSTSLGTHGSLLAMELAVLIAAAGRTWGLDSLLAKRTKVRIFW
ncbi:MAG TPA: TQO small subunit DoxD [Armatimonadota bacterium]